MTSADGGANIEVEGSYATPVANGVPGAWYHVMNRGWRDQAIFLGTDDFLRFLQVLEEGVTKWNVRISALCMIPNQYHLLIQTPDANLS